MGHAKHPPRADEVRSFLRDRHGDLRQTLSDLIRARTENPPGDEHRAAKILTQFCEAEGIPCETFEKAPGRTNVVARVGRGRPRIAVPLHFDVVPAGDGWETDPFEPVVRGDRIIGRGAKDNKGPLAVMMLAAKYLKTREAELPGTLLLVGAADEEAGSALGMRYLLEECGFEADAAIVPDAGHEMRRVLVGEKGVLFFKVVAEGRQAHGSSPERGASALWPVVDFLNRIRDWRPAAAPSDLFTPPTLNVGAIHAGTVPNMVPGRCEALVDVRYLPGTDVESILAHLRGVLAETAGNAAGPVVRDSLYYRAGVRMRLEVLSDQAPSQVATDHPLVKVIQRRTEEVTGERPKVFGQSGASVAKFLVLRGIPAVGFSCGPEGVEHMANEWISLDELVRFAEVMTLVVWDLMSEGE
ncbi:MAG TPA: ArgE/DapE family deacylase [Phycisphaerae bacterium]|nr:ArgE/DapE family deacylase [Phycisphaerae bacterium]